MEAFQKVVEKEFRLISSVAKQEVKTVTEVKPKGACLLNVLPELLQGKFEQSYYMTS